MSLAGFRHGNRICRKGLLVGALSVLLLTGCGPKKVIRTDPSAALPPPQEKSAGATPEEYASDIPPGEPDSDLPDPRYRGTAGTSSLNSAAAASPNANPPGTPNPEPLTGSRLGFEAAALAKKQLGKPYQWGAEGPDKFDCSGLVMYVYANLGVNLPRVSGRQAYAGVHVDQKDLQPGDLVFFRLNGSKIDHVGIYVGHSKFVHAPRKYQPVKTESLNNNYWRRRFTGGRRLG